MKQRKVLIGSDIIRNNFPDFKRDKTDTDYLVEVVTEKPSREIEYYSIPPLWNDLNNDQTQLTLNQLYTLKVSHSYWNIHWDKTMFDISYLKEKGCILDEKLHDNLYEHWKTVHGIKNVNLNKHTEEFFTDAVERKFNHDELHKIVAYYDEPLFKRILINKNKTLVSKKKFFEMDFIDQIRIVKEEAIVIALERFIIPQTTRNFMVAYNRALKILITSATKGWFPKFIVLNFNEIRKIDFNYKKIKNIVLN